MATGDISGQVRLENDVAAPAGTMVSLDRSDSGTAGQVQTDSQGKFQFRGLDPMIYRITVRLHGYETSRTEVDLQFVSHSYVQIKLKPLPRSAPSAGDQASTVDSRIPSAALAEMEKGNKLLTSNNPGKAIPHLSKAIQIYGRFTQAYVLLGLAYGAEQKWMDAGSAFLKAIECDASSAPAYIGLGGAQNNQQDYSGAEKSLLKALQLEPESVAAHLELSRTYWAMHRWQEAEPHAIKVVMLKPDHPGGHVIMGNILLQKRDNQAALKEFHEALRLAPNSELAPRIREVVKKLESSNQTPTQ